jgi:ribosomal protein S18 acetylase RimI-like enzyme
MKTTLIQPSVSRASGPADWQAAAELLRDYADWIRSAAAFDPFVKQPSFARELDDVAAHYSANNVALFIAFLGEIAVGTLAVSWRDGRDAELKRMYVSPSARGLGIADALLARALAEAQSRGCSHVWLESVRGAMDAAIAVYRRNGFCVVDDGTRTLDIDGVVVMRCQLSESDVALD